MTRLDGQDDATGGGAEAPEETGPGVAAGRGRSDMRAERMATSPRTGRGASAPAPWSRVARSGVVAWILCAAAVARGDGEDARLDALVAEALASHPAVDRARQELAAAEEVPSQRRALPDPMLEVAVQNIPTQDWNLDSSPMSGVQIGLVQAIPFPGKLQRRQRVASAQVEVVAAELAGTEAEVALQVRRAYWRLCFAQRAEAITAENVEVLDDLVDVVTARFSVGGAPQQDVLQVQVAHSRVRALLLERQQATLSQARALNRAVGRAPDADAPPTGDPPGGGGVELAPEPWLVRAEQANPAILASTRSVAAARASVESAEYERWPDLRVAAGYRFRQRVPGDPTNGSDMIGASVGITLPVFLRLRENARVREEGLRADAAASRLEDVRLAVRTELLQALDAVGRLDAQLQLYESELLPEADQALDASIGDYQVGRVELVSVLGNWEAQLEALLTHQYLLTQRAERLAEALALVGDVGRGDDS